MSLRVRTTCFRVFWGLRRREPTAKKAAAAAAAEVVLVVVRAATPKTWPRSTPKTTDTGDTSRGRLSSDDQNRSLFIFLADGCSAGRLLLFVSVFPSRRRYFVYICIANHSAVSKPHPTEGAEIYCIQAAGILAATKCAVRCAHRPVLVVVHAACLCCCWSFFFCCCLDFSFSNGHVILEK